MYFVPPWLQRDKKPPQRCAAGRQHHYRVSRCIDIKGLLASTCIFLRPSKSVPDLVPQCFYPLSPSTPDPLDKAAEEDDLSIIPCLKVPFSFVPLLHHRLHIVIDTGSLPENPSFAVSSASLSCQYHIRHQGVFRIKEPPLIITFCLAGYRFSIPVQQPLPLDCSL